MKSRKLLALFLAIFMLASLIVPASAETITPETNVTNGIVGYDSALVEKVDLTEVPDIKDYASNSTAKTFKITDYAGWQAFDALITAQYSLSDVTVYLANDIDCDADATDAVVKGVINPIGTITSSSSDWSPKAFAGVLDGQGYCIKNAILRPEHARQVNEGFYGLFMALSADKTDAEGCVIKNFIIDSSVEYDTSKDMNGTAISPNKVAIGGLVGTIDTKYGNSVTTAAQVGKITISNVMNKASFNYDAGTTGGLVMFAKCCTLIMENCTYAGTMTQTGTNANGAGGDKAIGGIVGALGEFNPGNAKGYFMDVTIANCRNTGTIKTNMTTAGGIVGAALNGFNAGNDKTKVNESTLGTKNRTLTISNCINNGDITCTVEATGWSAICGIFGFNKNWKTVSINNCKNYGTITGKGGSKGGDISGGSQFKVDGVQPITATNCVAAAGTPDPTYNMVAKYYQLSKTATDGKYSLRLIALHNGELTDLDAYSYDVTISYKDGENTVSKSASTGKLGTVKTSIVADKMGEGATVITNEMLGCKWISAVRVDNIPTDLGTITVTIVPTMYKGETTTTAAPITFTVDPTVAYPTNAQ